MDIDIHYKEYSRATRHSLEAWSGIQIDLGLVSLVFACPSFYFIDLDNVHIENWPLVYWCSSRHFKMSTLMLYCFMLLCKSKLNFFVSNVEMEGDYIHVPY